MANGKTIRCMEKDTSLGLMGKNILVNSRRTSDMAWENSDGRTAESMKANGGAESSTESGSTGMEKAKNVKASGSKAAEHNG